MTRAVTDEIFVDELQDAVWFGGIDPAHIANEFNVDICKVDDWLEGSNLPPRETQDAVLEFVEMNLV